MTDGRGQQLTWLALTPRDTVFVRDGRSFDAAADATAVTVRPWPSTVAGAVGAAPDHLLGQALDVRQALLVFAAGEEEQLVGDRGETLFQARALVAPYVLGGDDEYFAGLGGDVFSGVLQDAAFYHGVVGSWRGFYVEGGHIDRCNMRGAGSFTPRGRQVRQEDDFVLHLVALVASGRV